MAGLRPSRLTKHYPLKAVVGLRPATAFGVSGVRGRISAGCWWSGSPARRADRGLSRGVLPTTRDRNGIRQPRRLPRTATRCRPGRVGGRLAGGNHRGRTQRQAHRLCQRHLGSRPGRRKTRTPTYPWIERRLRTGVHRRRRPAVRVLATHCRERRWRRQTTGLAVAATRGRRRGYRSAEHARWCKPGPHRPSRRRHRDRRAISGFGARRRR